MKGTDRLLVVLVAPLLLAWSVFAAAPLSAQSAVNGATAELKDAQGQTIGRATLTSAGQGGARLQVSVNGFSSAAAGEHGIHIHAVGLCEAPGFTTAGGHFNPGGKKHGTSSPDGSHAGDLPNLLMGADGSASYEATVAGVTLDTGAATSLFDADGSAIVIHAGPDDYMTDPAGNSGARVACGVLQQALVPAGMPSTGGQGGPGLYLWLAAALAVLTGSLVVLRERRAA